MHRAAYQKVARSNGVTLAQRGHWTNGSMNYQQSEPVFYLWLSKVSANDTYVTSSLIG